jgi:CheY-like chemotaxis protein
MNKILFIEDNRTKAEDVSLFMSENYPKINFVIKESFASGLRELFRTEYDLLFLDMSIPTRDGDANSLINNFEQLGGYQILSEIKRKKKQIPTILITMFNDFGVNSSFINLEEINEICIHEFSEFYLGAVFYTSRENSWKEKLKIFMSDNLDNL